LILSRDDSWRKKLQSSVFPGVQGSIHTQILAAKAVCLGEALQPEFRDYAKQVVDNAASLASTLQSGGINIVSGGTDTHIVLLDLETLGLKGREAEALLDQINITSNKNPVPFDVSNPNDWVGLRLGVAAATTRGFKQAEFKQVGQTIAEVLTADDTNRENRLSQARDLTARLCSAHPIY